MEETKRKNPRKPMDEAKKKKIQKIVSIIINILVVIILALALVITIFNLVSKNNNKGYTAFGSTAYLTVESNSMDSNLKAGGTYDIGDSVYHSEGVKIDVGSFKVGDLLRIHLLSAEEKLNLKVGQVITFRMNDSKNNEFFNSHRIVAVDTTKPGETIYYTKGDNNQICDQIDDGFVLSSKNVHMHEIIGVVEKNVGGIGNVFRFFRSSTGFLVCVVVPSFLIVIYFTVNLVRELMKRRAAGAGDRKEKMKAELIAELRAQGLISENAPIDGEGNPAEGGETVIAQPAEGENAAEQHSEGENAAESAENAQPAEEEKPAEVVEPAEAEPVAEQPEVEAPAAEEPAVEESAVEEPADEKPVEAVEAVEEVEEVEKPAAKKPAAKSAAKKPASKSAAKKPAAKSAAKKPATKKPTNKS